MGKTFRASYTI